MNMTQLELENPYLAAFEAIVPQWRIPYHLRPLSDISVYSRREELVTSYAWAVPTAEAIQAIAALSPIVEMGAGTGYWAMLLKQAGADVLAFDAHPPSKGVNGYRHKQEYFPVQLGGPRVLKQHADRTLFLCWPPYDTPMAQQCLVHYQGTKLVYVGEDEGGCNGSKGFWRELARNWRPAACLDLPQWNGIHDYCWIYEPREGKMP